MLRPVLLAFVTRIATAAVAPTVEIAPGVHMPMVVDGFDNGKQTNETTNYTTWFALGGRGVDTAWSYFNQKAVGASLHSQKVVPRSEIFLQTKIECMGSMESTIKAGELDLQLLGESYVDLLLIHTPYLGWGEPYSNCSKGLAGKAARQASWRGMEALLKAGKTRAIGVSNFNAEELAEILEVATVPPAVNQAALSVGHSDNATINYQAKLSPPMTYQAYSPLGGMDWDPTAPSVMSVPVVQDIATAINRTAAQVALRYVIQRGFPLATASIDPKHLADDLDIFGWSLSPHHMALLNSVRFPTPSSAHGVHAAQKEEYILYA